MLSLPTRTNVYLCARPVDLRKSFDGLSAMVEVVFQRNVFDGHLFLFINKRRDRIKAMWWEEGGLVIWYKKFESHYPHFLLFTGIGRYRDNLACRPAAAVGMDSGPPRIGPRRRPMPGEIAVIVPPRAEFAAGP
jgi:hypothetical protein